MHENFSLILLFTVSGIAVGRLSSRTPGVIDFFLIAENLMRPSVYKRAFTLCNFSSLSREVDFRRLNSLVEAVGRTNWIVPIVKCF